MTTEIVCATILTGPSTSRLNASSEVPAARPSLELWRLPEGAESDERDDQDDGTAPVEEPPGNGEILDPPDPVGQHVWQERGAQGRTVS